MRATGAAQVEGMERNVQGAERARIDIESSLGAPGTYDLPNGLGLNSQTGTGASPTAANTGGLIQSSKATSFWATQGIPEGNVETLNTLDPDAVSARTKSSAEFRIRSRMTAESEQMLARTGPLYDSMIKNQVTPVSEALGAAARESMAERKQMMARGGAARRQAFQMESELRQKADLASKKATAMSDIFQKTDLFARDYATKTLEGNQAWLNNLAGIRDNHTQLANGVYESMLNDALPNMFKAEMANHELRTQAAAAKKAKTMAMYKTVAAVALVAVGGGAAAMGMMGAMGAGAGAVSMGSSMAQSGLSMLGQQEGAAGVVGGVGGGLLDAYNNQQASNQAAQNRLPSNYPGMG